MTSAELATLTETWVADSDSDVVWAGDHEGRRGVRMRQQARDFTTVWFSVGERTVSIEAYVLPKPPPDRLAATLRLCMIRNRSVRRMHFALDEVEGILLLGKIPLREVDEQELEMALAEVYQLVETTFRPLVRLLTGRERLA